MDVARTVGATDGYPVTAIKIVSEGVHRKSPELLAVNLSRDPLNKDTRVNYAKINGQK